jgi:hypothetical protein
MRVVDGVTDIKEVAKEFAELEVATAGRGLHCPVTLVFPHL